MRFFVLLFLMAVGACAGTPSRQPPQAPRAAEPRASEQPTALERLAAPKDPLSVVTPPPEHCQAFTAHEQGGAGGCETRDGLLSAVDRALSQEDPVQVDAALALLESCAAAQPGLILALRAEMAPLECADAVSAGEAVEQAKASELGSALRGLQLAAQLSRLVREPPQPDPPHTKERIREFIRDSMASWVTEQAKAIESLALEGSKLEGYGKGIVAVEAGLADMRFVEAFRSVPIPEEFAGDAELTDAYYASLDQALEPRKERGRDAALVGLRVLGELGILVDARVERARKLLSHLYNGRRIDALDGLMLPPRVRARPKTVEERLATKLPAYYVPSLLKGADLRSPALMTAILERGLPEILRNAAERRDTSRELRALLARSLFELGRTYWRAADFARARALLSSLRPATAENKLLEALALALETGPRDAATMMLRGPMPKGVGNISQLEAVAKKKGAVAGMAEYDAAYVLELVPPQGRDAAFFEELAARYRRAAGQLEEPSAQERARERANAAEATARAVR